MNCLSNCFTLVLATISAITFAVDLWVNYDSAMKSYSTIKDISDKHITQIQPENWLFMIWDVIYVLFIIWYIQVFLLLFRQLCCGKNKAIFPGIFWFIFIIINVLNGLWIRLYSKNYMIISGILLLILTLMLYLINMIAFRVCWMDVTYQKCNNDENDVERNNDVVELSRCEVVLLRLTTLNGLPLYAMWCTIASALQWTMIFQYDTFHWSSTLACVVPLSVLALLLLMYAFMDVVTLRKYFVYTWSPCIALIVAFSAILARNHSIGGHNRGGLTFVFILLISVVAVTMLRLVSLCCCRPKYENPRFSRV